MSNGLTNDVDLEIKRPKKVAATAVVQTPTDRLLAYFSSWETLRKSVGWMLRLKEKLLNRVRRSKDDITKNMKLTVEELNRAETAVFKYVQMTHFSRELLDLSKQRYVAKSSPLHNLDPRISEGLIRIGGRLKNAQIPDDAKHQILLPKDYFISTLLIRYHHRISAHGGRNYVLSLLRKRYWIIKGNSAVCRVLKDCLDCRRKFGPVGAQKMSDLPDDRVVSEKPPFTNVGVDYFGPFEVKRGRSIVKRYGCIFTCLSIRAVHIEIANSLDTDSFIDALRRFICRRGQPEVIRSDNGTNFVGGEKELRLAINEWNQHKIEDFLQQRNIVWKLNPPLASHQGGVWERCIRTVRKILKSLLGNQTVDEEGLCTLMCEVEAIINGRPLTPVSDDPRDLSALTPNHLLLLRYSTTFPPGLFRKEDIYIRRRWKQVQYLADQFWVRWIREYLPILQTRNKWQQTRRNFAKGDLVLVEDNPLTPRNNWPIGLVMDVYPANDGTVRQVLVRMRNKLFRRDVRKLCLLGCGSTEPGAE